MPEAGVDLLQGRHLWSIKGTKNGKRRDINREPQEVHLAKIYAGTQSAHAHTEKRADSSPTPYAMPLISALPATDP